MEVKSATRRVSVFNQVAAEPVKAQVCSFWLQGRCNRNPCKFMHRESPPPHPHQAASPSAQSNKRTWKNPEYNSSNNGTKLTNKRTEKSCINGDEKVQVEDRKKPRHIDQKRISISSEVIRSQPVKQEVLNPVSRSNVVEKSQQSLCKYWVAGNCVYGDKCKNLHSWVSGSGFTKLATLEKHNKAIAGIALPSGSDRLYSCSKDGHICVWDCNSGQCVGSVDLQGEIECMISDGHWMFAALRNTIKVWNFQNQTEFSLNKPVGTVRSMVEGNGMLFAGVEEGTILAWNLHQGSANPKLAARMKGHNGAVSSLIVGANKLYSGLSDGKIQVWNLENLQCVQTLDAHTGNVIALLCWDVHLLSSSSDNTLKVWATAEGGSLEVVYERKEDCGIVALRGVHDSEAHPILLCLCKDNTVRLYDLPSFNERGKVFSDQAVQVVETALNSLFFSGDDTGRISIWRVV